MKTKIKTLKALTECKTDAEFAKFIGVSAHAMKYIKKNNTPHWERIFSILEWVLPKLSVEDLRSFLEEFKGEKKPDAKNRLGELPPSSTVTLNKQLVYEVSIPVGRAKSTFFDKNIDKAMDKAFQFIAENPEQFNLGPVASFPRPLSKYPYSRSNGSVEKIN
jgi:hypothetical protein